MIAPEQPGRHAASRRAAARAPGLIRGLRGVAPFDGSALSAAAMGRHARRRRRHRVHRRLDRRRLPGRSARRSISARSRPRAASVAHAEARRRRGVRRRDRRAALRLSRGRAAPAPEPRLPRRARGRAAARRRSAPSTTSTSATEDRRNLQQPGADPSEPLPARLGALPALASRLSLRVRAEPAGLRPRHHAPVLGLDDAAVSAGRPDQRLHHSAGLQGLPHGRSGRLR